jgi:hypothetical protein
MNFNHLIQSATRAVMYETDGRQTPAIQMELVVSMQRGTNHSPGQSSGWLTMPPEAARELANQLHKALEQSAAMQQQPKTPQ